MLVAIDVTQRFFQSKVEETTLKDKGKYSMKVKRTRQRNRICRVRFNHSIYAFNLLGGGGVGDPPLPPC